MIRRWRLAARPLAAAVATLLWLVAGAGAQTPPAGTGQRLTEIRVEGARRIEPETIRSYMTLKPGDPITAAALDDSLKALFATGLFSDLNLRQEGSVVVVRVVENPIINRIAFEGNRRLSDETLEQEVRLRPRIVFTRSRVQSDVQRLIDLYRRNGRFAATVEPKVIQLPQNRVDLVFEINEGELTEIRRIVFIGNRHFDDSDLRGVIQTKEAAWYNIFATTDTYDPDRLTFDRELLRRHYLANGYADFRVVSAVAELTPDQTGFVVTFTLEEGERYRFGKIDLKTALKKVDLDALRKAVTIEDGAWYDADAVEATISALSDVVGSQGYAFVDITPQVRRNRDAHTIDVTFHIQEGPRVFVERINIAGNVRTEDRVIRREFDIVEGDAFNSTKLRRARQRIRNLGFFSLVDVTNVPGSDPDKTVINVNVRERSTGEVSFGVGFSSGAGLLGDVSIRERNLLGKGQDLRLGLRLGQREQQVDLSFTEPYFLQRDLSAGFDVFATKRDLQRESSFDQASQGFALRMGYGLAPNLRQRLRYMLRRDKISNVDQNASLVIKDQEGAAVTSLVGQALRYDTRDNRFDPTTGYYVELSNDFAGLGGDVHHIRSQLIGAYFIPVAQDWVASIGGGAGYIIGFDDRVRIVDRFFLGGDQLRGFASAGVGPRDLDTNDALGGKWYYRGSVELMFPLGLPDEFGIRGRVFSDFGSVGDAENDSAADVTDVASIRVSAGAGIGWRSPFGPVNVDVGFPLKKEDFDKTETFRFSFGTRF